MNRRLISLNRQFWKKSNDFVNASQLRKKLLSGGMWATLGQVLVLITSVVVSGLLARLLSPNDLGSYFLIVSVVTSLSIIGMLGMGQTVIRLVAVSSSERKNEATIAAISGTTFWVLLGTILVVSIFVLLGMNLGYDGILVAFVATWVSIRVWENFLSEIFRGFGNIREAVLFKQLSTKFISALFLSISFITLHSLGLTTAIALLVLASTLSVLLALGTLYGGHIRPLMHSIPGRDVSFGLNFSVLGDALPVLGVNLVTILRSQVSIWIVAAFLAKEDVAIYGAADRLTVLIIASLSIANSFLPPIIADLYAKGETRKLERTIRSVATATSVPAIILMILFVLLGQFILRITYGNFYTASWIILVLLALGQTLNVCFGSPGLVLVMTGHQRTMMKISIISMVITVFGVLIGVKFGGNIGVAISVTLGLIIQNSLMLMFVKRKIGIWAHLKLRW